MSEITLFMCDNHKFILCYKFVLYNFQPLDSFNLYCTDRNGELPFLKSGYLHLHILQMFKTDFFPHEAISLGFLFSSHWNEQAGTES
jgi:hypothetical protein